MRTAKTDQIGRMHMPFCWFCHEAAHFNISMATHIMVFQLTGDNFQWGRQRVRIWRHQRVMIWGHQRVRVWQWVRGQNQNFGFSSFPFNHTCWPIMFKIYEVLYIKWATSWENLFMPYANNKGADQPVHPCSLISTFVVPCLDSIISLVSIFAISWP